MRVLVTGGGGFLGTAIVRKLQTQGHIITVVARGNYPWMSAAGIRLCRGDLADKASVQEAFQEQDLVIHSAAKAGVWGPHQDYVRSNLEATHNVLALCREAAHPSVVVYVFTFRGF
jgi:nucleoside-diphosphate-sugar epimerase